MSDNKMSEMIETSINSLKSIAGADTIIGEAIKADDGTTIVPVSKLSVGFVSGGLDYAGKNTEKKNNYGGAGGTGLSLTPICFIVMHTDGRVEMLNVNEPLRGYPDPVGDVIGLVERSPEIISRIKEIFKKED